MGILDAICRPFVASSRQKWRACVVTTGNFRSNMRVFSSVETNLPSFPGWTSKQNVPRKENIFLMGSPGCGKTTVGQLLGAKMNLPVIDIDTDYLEKRWNMPVADKLFSSGSEAFVQEEGEALLQFDASGSVVSLSGSNPLHQDGMDHIRKSGIVVFIDVQEDDILRRLDRIEVKRIVGQEAGVRMPDILKYRQQFYAGNYDVRVICEAHEGPESITERVVDAVHDVDNPEGYVSTREDITKATPRDFNEAVLEGLAWDGGLYVPGFHLPALTPNQWARLIPKSYPERAQMILERWIHPRDLHPSALRPMLEQAYGASHFRSDYVFPVEKLHKESLVKNQYLLELFHGPTASFKDAALQLTPKFFQHAMKVRNEERYLILVATSGDTGGAVLDGFGQLPGDNNVQVMVLYPEGGISAIQKAQMTAMEGDNVSVIGVKSDFDFCQTAVKKIFCDPKLSAELRTNFNCKLSSGNSMNWGRLLPQVVYHCSAYLDLVKSHTIVMGQPVDLCIPTGNFGNMLAAYYAKAMGIPYRWLITASNANNILTEFVNTGSYTLLGRSLVKTSSPAIDILQSSNLERLLYHVTSSDHTKVRDYYSDLERDGRFVLSKQDFRHVTKQLRGDWCTEDTCLSCIHDTYKSTGYLLDPHTAVAKTVADKFHDDNVPMVIASTAHYAKFAPDVLRALGHSVIEDDARRQLEVLGQLGATPGMHASLLERIHRPRVHDKVLEANHGDIVREIKSFLGSR